MESWDPNVGILRPPSLSVYIYIVHVPPVSITWLHPKAMFCIQMRKRVKRNITTKTESNLWILIHHTRKFAVMCLPWSFLLIFLLFHYCRFGQCLSFIIYPHTLFSPYIVQVKPLKSTSSSSSSSKLIKLFLASPVRVSNNFYHRIWSIKDNVLLTILRNNTLTCINFLYLFFHIHLISFSFFKKKIIFMNILYLCI